MWSEYWDSKHLLYDFFLPLLEGLVRFKFCAQGKQGHAVQGPRDIFQSQCMWASNVTTGTICNRGYHSAMKIIIDLPFGFFSNTQYYASLSLP